MVMVETTIGMIPRDELEVRDIVIDTDDSRNIRTEWWYKGERVRWDVTVSILRGIALNGVANG